MGILLGVLSSKEIIIILILPLLSFIILIPILAYWLGKKKGA